MRQGAALFFAALLVLWTSGSVTAQEASADTCQVPPDLTEDNHSLSIVRQVLASGGPLRIVALGSTSSTGKGASSRERSYVRQLETELRRLLPRQAVVVADLTGDKLTAAAMSGLVQPKVLPLKPSLVVWEVGTTDAIQGIDPTDFGEALDQSARMIQEAGADIILITPQYSPNTAELINFQPYLDVMRQIANAHDLVLFPRGLIMRHYFEAGRFTVAASNIQTRGGDFVNGCLARQLAAQIARASAQ